MYSLMLLAEVAENVAPVGISQLEIAAVIGALLIIARVVVKFTVTKRDDKAVEKIARWLKVVRVVTGLPFGKGVDKYKP